MRLLLFTILTFASSNNVQALRFHRSSNVTLRGEDQLTIFQIGDDSYISKYEPWTRTVQQYAEAHGAHHLVVSTTARPTVDLHCGSDMHTCSISNKPQYIMREMDDMGSNPSWLIFLDLDIAIANPEAFANANMSDMETMKRFLTARKSSMKHSMKTLHDYLDSLGATCDFVGQDSHHTINSGFLAFKGPFDSKSKSLSRNLVHLWKNETDRIQPWGSWLGDQGPLQSALLTLASQTFNASYDNKCDMKAQTANLRNLCWNEMMTQLNLPLNNRSFGKYCLLSTMHRWNMHDSGERFHYGDVLYHGKDRRVVESITR